jgi:phosphoribosylglycinamide formyltransferase 1
VGVGCRTSRRAERKEKWIRARFCLSPSHLSPPMRVIILGSGRGSNAEALCAAYTSGRLGRAEIVGIFSDRPEAGILALGPRFGVPSRYLDPAPFKTKLEGEGERRYIAEIAALEPALIVLAGFMRVVKPGFLAAFPGRVINLHPSLLPSFPGLDGIGQALRHGVRVTGCTVHEVSAEIDAGRILDQAAVRVEPDDTHETLAARVHAAEHALLVSVVTRLSLNPPAPFSRS